MEKNKLPIVSIIGRPNVGKSRLFNRIVGRPVAVVDDHWGVTRDRNYRQVVWDEYPFMITDTGGLLPSSSEPIPKHIQEQVMQALKESSVVIFLVEHGTGPTDLDLQIARLLHKKNKRPVLLVVNKVESAQARLDSAAFLSLGLGEPRTVSALHGDGVGDLLDQVVGLLRKNFKTDDVAYTFVPKISVAIVGRPNAGKSSIVNKLLREPRMIVDDVPGTTRDAVDSRIRYKDTDFVLIDTAGLRQKSHVKTDLEYYCNVKALSSIDRADCAVLVIDATASTVQQNFKILTYIVEQRKGVIICLNKWDLVAKDQSTYKKMVAELHALVGTSRFLHIIATSALTGQRLPNLLDAVSEVHQHMRARVSSSEFRKRCTEWIQTHPHPFVGPIAVKVFAGKQKDASFPLFNFYASHPKKVLESYRRYLMNKIYTEFNFKGCPVVLEFKTAAQPKHG
ncbi:MAG: ribosome biogenesis GTPase Der [Chitinivibrionales bacterium]|nr:ribosome biogenesis GTPase Der [Chitinivibrionales bacterium]